MNINVDQLIAESQSNKGRISGLDNLLRQAYSNCVEVMASNFIYQNQISELQSLVASLKKENEDLKAKDADCNKAA